MIWNKEPVFQPDEDGARVENKRFRRLIKGHSIMTRCP